MKPNINLKILYRKKGEKKVELWKSSTAKSCMKTFATHASVVGSW